jgi:hypothetical protein
MSFKIGFEREYFCVNEDGDVVVVPQHLPHDDCGWLFESRGRPDFSVFRAIYDLDFEDRRLDRMLRTHNARPSTKVKISPSLVSVRMVPKAVRDAARRIFRKDLVTEKNIYGHKSHRNRITEGVAGLHVSITAQNTVATTTGAHNYNRMWDFVPFVHALDAAFAEEIRAAKRRPGFYDIHHDGRFEYRSLPATVDVDKLEREIEGALQLCALRW